MWWKSVIVAGICMLFVNSLHCLLPNSNGIEVIESNGVIEVDVTTTEAVNHLDLDIEEDARLKTVRLFLLFYSIRAPNTLLMPSTICAEHVLVLGVIIACSVRYFNYSLSVHYYVLQTPVSCRGGFHNDLYRFWKHMTV